MNAALEDSLAHHVPDAPFVVGNPRDQFSDREVLGFSRSVSWRHFGLCPSDRSKRRITIPTGPPRLALRALQDDHRMRAGSMVHLPSSYHEICVAHSLSPWLACWRKNDPSPARRDHRLQSRWPQRSQLGGSGCRPVVWRLVAAGDELSVIPAEAGVHAGNGDEPEGSNSSLSLLRRVVASASDT